MKRMMLNMAVAAGLVGLGGAALLGPTAFRTTVLGARENAKETIDSLKSDSQLAAEVKVELEQLDQDIASRAGKLGVFANKLEAAKAELKQLNKRLADERTILKRAAAMLTAGAPVEINGRMYTMAELNEDAASRAEAYKRLQATTKVREKAKEELQKLIDTVTAELANHRDHRVELAGKLSNLTIRLEGAQMVAEMDAYASRLRSSNAVQRAQHAMDQLEQRVIGLESQTSAALATTTPGKINWGTAPDAKVVIREALGELGTDVTSNAETEVIP